MSQSITMTLTLKKKINVIVTNYGIINILKFFKINVIVSDYDIIIYILI